MENLTAEISCAAARACNIPIRLIYNTAANKARYNTVENASTYNTAANKERYNTVVNEVTKISYNYAPASKQGFPSLSIISQVIILPQLN